MSATHKLAYLLLIIGGLNWGLVGFFNYNLVDEVLSDGLAKVIYAVVGLAALYSLGQIAMRKSQSR